MYLMYVDESGDTGLKNTPTRYFILSALVLHELRWRPIFDAMIDFRRVLRNTKGLRLREEIHAQAFVHKPGDLSRIKRNDRLDILKKCIDWTAAQTDISVITVAVDKNRHRQRNTDVFELAWSRLFQRFENTLQHRNFPGPANPDERGVVISDATAGMKLTRLLRRMRQFNPVPNRMDLYGAGFRHLGLTYVIEDPVFRHSPESYFIQMVDVVAYFARQLYEPNAYVRRKGAKTFYNRLMPVINPYVTQGNPLSIVEA